MRRSFKILLVLAVIAFGYVFLPYFFGFFTQRYAQDFSKHENESLMKVFDVQATLIDYRRGWFHSSAVLVFKSINDPQPRELYRIPIVITHGPFYRVHGHMWAGFGALSSQDVLINSNVPYALEFRENITFDGEHSLVALLAKKKGISTPNHLHFSTLKLTGKSNMSAHQFVFQLTAHGLHFDDMQTGTTVRIKDLYTQLAAQYIKDRDWHLTFNMSLTDNKLRAPMDLVKNQFATLQFHRFNLMDLHLNTQKLAEFVERAIKLRQQEKMEKLTNFAGWISLGQDFLSAAVTNQTWLSVKKLVLTTPMGQVEFHYRLSFPTLPKQHDYFDLATHDVSDLRVQIPQFLATNHESHEQYVLNQFFYQGYANTIFSRDDRMSFDLFDVKNIEKNYSVIHASDFLYHGQAYGDPRWLSQTMRFQLGALCFSDACYKKLDGDLQFLHVSYDGVRALLKAAHQIAQAQSSEPKILLAQWTDMASAYAQLVSYRTQLQVSFAVQTLKGDASLHGETTWPTLPVEMKTPPTMTEVLHQAHYQLQVIFPMAYITEFLAEHSAHSAPAPTTDATDTTQIAHSASFGQDIAHWLRFAMQQGYLQKVGDAYHAELKGVGTQFTINGRAWKMMPKSNHSPQNNHEALIITPKSQ